MKPSSCCHFFLAACLVLSSLMGTGCTSSDDSGVLNPSKNGLQGTWSYIILNGNEATYTDCTGDAAVLEGVSFAEAAAVVPICLVSSVFDVVQAEESFTVVAHEVTCSDGSTGSAFGEGAIIDGALSGEWETTSGGGVVASQSFTGEAIGNTLEVRESERVFSGSLQGSCEISPDLTVLISVD